MVAEKAAEKAGPVENTKRELTANGAALLGLLAIEGWDRRWTTYELAKQARRSVHWVWPRAERLLYDIPKKLVKQGYARARSTSTGKRPSVEYTITDDGRQALRAWLDSEGQPPVFDIEQLIRVFYGDHGTVTQLHRNIEILGRQAAASRAQLSEIVGDGTRASRSGRAAVNALSLKLVDDLHRTIEDWAHWARETTDDWTSPTPEWPGAAEIFREVGRPETD